MSSLLDDFKAVAVGVAIDQTKNAISSVGSKLSGGLGGAIGSLFGDKEELEEVTVTAKKRGQNNQNNSFNINEFRTELNVNGLLRPLNYLVVFNNPRILDRNQSIVEGYPTKSRRDTRFLTLRCESATMPGVNFFTSDDIRRYGYGPLERRPYLPTFNPITLSFLVDRQAKIIEYFYSWTNGIVDYNASKGMINPNTKPYFMNYKSEYISNSMSIWVYDESFDKQILVTLRDVFPLAVSDVSLNWGSTNEPIRFSVVLQYTDMFMKFKGSGLSATGDEITAMAEKERPEFKENKSKGFLGILEGFVQGKIYEAEEKLVNKVLNVF